MPDTVTEALQQLAADGYTSDFRLVDGSLVSGDRSPVCQVEDVRVERMYRFEGDSDPGDEMVVFGLRDPASGERGALASAFGPAADPEVLDHLAYLAAHVDR
ncbi:MAG TPA: hypothetical protein VGM93_12950 [Acidimicrobiales bacterium]